MIESNYLTFFKIITKISVNVLLFLLAGANIKLISNLTRKNKFIFNLFLTLKTELDCRKFRTANIQAFKIINLVKI